MSVKCELVSQWLLKNDVIPLVPFQSKGSLYQSQFYRMSRPLLWLQLLLARHPFYVQSGKMKFAVISLPVAYSALVVAFCGCALILYNSEILEQWSTTNNDIDFSSIIFRSSTLLRYPMLVLTVFSWLVESPKIVQNYNAMASLERNISAFLSAPIVERRTSQIITSVLVLYLLCFMIVNFSLVQSVYPDVPWYFFIVMVIMYALLHLTLVLWCYVFLFIRHLSVKLRKHTLLSLRPDTGRTHQLRFCHKTWICLYGLSNKCSDSIGVSVILISIVYGTTVVIATYGLIVAVLSDANQLFAIAPYFTFPFFHIVAVIEVAHRTSCTLGDRFLHALIQTNKDLLDRENSAEVDRFIKTIVRLSKAKVTLKGFVSVDRALLASFMSYAVTYLIVLLQYRAAKQMTD